MVTTTCPWCDETATVSDTTDVELVCDGCGIRAAIAPDPVTLPLDRAA